MASRERQRPERQAKLRARMHKLKPQLAFLEAIRAELDLTQKEFETQLAAYREHLIRFHSLPKNGRAN